MSGAWELALETEHTPSDERWSWPIELAGYDACPELTRAERAALAGDLADLDRPRTRVDQFPRALRRLLLPLEDVLDHTRSKPAERVNLFRVVAIHTHECGRSAWGWTHDEWVQVLNRDHSVLAARYVSGDQWRADLVAFAYLLVGFQDWRALRRVERIRLAARVFGKRRVAAACDPVMQMLHAWGYSRPSLKAVRLALCDALLARRSPELRDLNTEFLRTLYADAPKRNVGYLALSRALVELRAIDAPLDSFTVRPQEWPSIDTEGVPPRWTEWCRRWYCTSTLRVTTRDGYYSFLLKAGRWLAAVAPDVTGPEQWTRETAAAFVAAVERMRVGDWVLPNPRQAHRVGQPMVASARAGHLTALRAFFRDGQEWGWFSRRFDPRRALATPRSTLALLGPRPNVLADDIWAKLVWAGLNLTADDLHGPSGGPPRQYPLAMVRAVAATWLFAGLRSDELRRLAVGCVRWQHGDAAGDRVCLLDVPANKTGAGFTKPVDRVVGEAIAA